MFTRLTQRAFHCLHVCFSKMYGVSGGLYTGGRLRWRPVFKVHCNGSDNIPAQDESLSLVYPKGQACECYPNGKVLDFISPLLHQSCL